MEAVMMESPIEIDGQALMEAARVLGTTTPSDTVNAALREVVAVRRRLEAYDELAKMGREGHFDELLDKRNYRPRP
ncbi:type II toxin-antitoxin system VapB family antitoxin [Actinoplanes missouriensis]|uniref:type II toxin-antitoxin system VapB family antitoxin n=1 Tax=Actinoplanes missouriensis TaxID=1866 RepID=UPI0033D689FA